MKKPFCYHRNIPYYEYLDELPEEISNLSDTDLEDIYHQGKFLRDLIRHDPHIPGSGRTRFFLELCNFNQEKADELCNKEEKVFRLIKEERWRRGKGMKGLKD